MQPYHRLTQPATRSIALSGLFFFEVDVLTSTQRTELPPTPRRLLAIKLAKIAKQADPNTKVFRPETGKYYRIEAKLSGERYNVLVYSQDYVVAFVATGPEEHRRIYDADGAEQFFETCFTHRAFRVSDEIPEREPKRRKKK